VQDAPGVKVAQTALQMKKPATALAGALTLFALTALPSSASAETFTFVCEPAQEPAPPQWFGGPWQRTITVRVDSQARMVEVYDQNGSILGGTLRASRLAGLGGYEFDMSADENVIRWGIVRMWSTSGYIDRRSGRIDMLWTNENGQSPESLTRQFHGTCHRPGPVTTIAAR
jgi:hypothetical protein